MKKLILLILWSLQCYECSHFVLLALGAANAPVAGVPLRPTTDMATQKSTQAGPKAPSSQPAIVNSDSTPPATPAKRKFLRSA